MSVTLSDIPLKGMVKDRLGKKLAEMEGTDLLNTWREQGELRARPGLTSFRSRPTSASGPVQSLFLAELADGTRATLRFDQGAAYSDSGLAWSEIVPGNPSPANFIDFYSANPGDLINTGSISGLIIDSFGQPFWHGAASQPFGVAMVLNEVIVSNGITSDGVKRWTGSGDFQTIPNAGVLVLHPSFRYVTQFASRIIGAYTSGTNGAVTIVGSANGSTTDWTTAGGAFTAVRNENPSIITGLSSDDNTLVVWKERAIIIGVESGDPDEPIKWSLLRAEGIGNITPRCILSYAGFWAAISHEGFYILSGGQPEFIDADIKRDFLKRINFDALRQCHALMMPEFGKAIFFIAEGTDPYPRNAWVYDFLNRGWERWQLGVAVTASARSYISTGNPIDFYSDNPLYLVDTGSISGTIIDTLGTGISQPVYILGDSNGFTYTIDPTASDDNGGAFAFNWESPDIRWEGIVDEETGESVGPRDLVTLDRVALEYNHSGSSASVECSVSVDGGLSYAVLETKSISSTTSSYTPLDFWGRVTGLQIRIRIRISQVMGLPRFRSMSVWGHPAGEIR